jgi:hypothetical protein
MSPTQNDTVAPLRNKKKNCTPFLLLLIKWLIHLGKVKQKTKNYEIKCSLYVYTLQCLDAPFDPSSGFIARDQQAKMNPPKSYFSVSHKNSNNISKLLIKHGRTWITNKKKVRQHIFIYQRYNHTLLHTF